jgi:hypothetical protein
MAVLGIYCFDMPVFSDVFEWASWDDMGIKLFYECVLIRDVGSFKSGHYFDYVSFNHEDFKVKFYTKFGDDTPGIVKTMRLVD